MKKTMAAAAFTVLLGAFASSQAFAFSDVTGDQQTVISNLQEKGVVSGIDSEHFAPQLEMSYAEALQMIVKAFNLNLDIMRFIKMPVASDVYPNAKDNAWYSDALVFGYYNGLKLPSDLDPSAKITREQFGSLLVKAMERKGELPMVKMFIEIEDNDNITTELQGSIERLLLYRVTQLNEEGEFLPQSPITRGEAASWIYNGSAYLEHWSQSNPQNEEGVSADQ